MTGARRGHVLASSICAQRFLAVARSLLAPDIAFGWRRMLKIELIAQREPVRVLNGASAPVWRYFDNLFK